MSAIYNINKNQSLPKELHTAASAREFESHKTGRRRNFKNTFRTCSQPGGSSSQKSISIPELSAKLGKSFSARDADQEGRRRPKRGIVVAKD